MSKKYVQVGRTFCFVTFFPKSFVLSQQVRIFAADLGKEDVIGTSKLIVKQSSRTAEACPYKYNKSITKINQKTMKKDLYLKPTIRVVEMRSRSQMLQYSQQGEVKPVNNKSTKMNVQYTESQDPWATTWGNW